MIDGRAIGDAIVGAIIIAFIVGVVAATALFFCIPWLWNVIKPLIHNLTAG